MYPVFKCVVVATSSLPFQTPVVNPVWSWGAFFDGCGRPSIQIVIGARVSHAPTIHACTLPVMGSGTAHIRRLNGPAAICRCAWSQQVPSGIEMMDCEKLSAFAHPDSLKGSPAQSSGFGPPPRSSASSWLIACHDPDTSISANAGAVVSATIANVSIVLRVIKNSIYQV